MRLMTAGTATALALVAIGGAGTALADPGHGRGPGDDRGRDDRRGAGVQQAPGAGAQRDCTRPRPAVGYVFRGVVTATAADAVTVDLVGANAHARWALAKATPPVVISRTAATDLLLVPTAGARVMRNGVIGTPRVGDFVNVKYRAPHAWKSSSRCPGAGVATVTVTGTPPVATFSGTGVTLKRVSAWGPTSP